MKQLPGQYVMYHPRQLSRIFAANARAAEDMSGNIKETADEEEWVRLYRQSSPDVILTSQIFSFANFTNKEDEIRRSCTGLVARTWFETDRRAPVYL